MSWVKPETLRIECLKLEIRAVLPKRSEKKSSPAVGTVDADAHLGQITI